MKKGTKTRVKLLALTIEQRDEIGRRIEELIKTDLSYVVNKYIRQYRSAAADTFGWDTDDLTQHIRVILWKGLATFDESRNYKLTTYLSSILYYQMGNFSKLCQSKKNSNSKLCFPEVMVSSDDTVEYNTAEDWYAYAEQFKKITDKLTENEIEVLKHYLIEGDTLAAMEKKIAISRIELITIIKNLKSKIIEALKED